MFTYKQRITYFLIFCIPIRIILSFLPLYLNSQYLYYLGLITLIPSFVFLIFYFKGIRLKAPEGGGKTWWADLRLLHGLLYLCGSIYLLQGKRTAYIPFVIDVIVGLLSFINKEKISIGL